MYGSNAIELQCWKVIRDHLVSLSTILARAVLFGLLMKTEEALSILLLKVFNNLLLWYHCPLSQVHSQDFPGGP